MAPSHPGDPAWIQDHGLDSFRKFRYSPLQPRHIRLLRLDRPVMEHHGRISGTIVTVDIGTCPAYTALSYEWGAGNMMHPLVINGNSWFATRSNLHDFLQHWIRLIEFDEGAYIWIDQICINQADTFERNAQVKLMSRIYSQAEDVIAWLGSDPDCERCVELLHWGGDKTRNPDYNDRGVIQALLDLGPQGVRTVTKFAENTYWKRLWIVQELLLAKRVHIMSGKIKMQRRELQSADYFGLPAEVQDLLPIDLDGPIYKREGANRKDAPERWDPRQYSKQSLGDTIHSHYEKLCQDPRDKVYGLMGIVPEEEQIPIDYNLSADEVFCAAADRMLQSDIEGGGSTSVYTMFRLYGAMFLGPRPSVEEEEAGEAEVVQYCWRTVGKLPTNHAQRLWFIEKFVDRFWLDQSIAD